ncbi:basic blue protein [Quercus suber]|uniref:Basic blue protein n=1 Tax=Quercus suber TaxID=58331 RepID=A0AAW0M930_QUESU
MAPQGRGSAIVVSVLLLVFNYNPASHNVVGVGKSGYDTCTASSGQTFQSGSDQIKLVQGGNYFICVFNYNPAFHNVVGVGKNGYDTCTASSGQTFQSGSDQIKLVQGGNYFICGFPGHCANNMKIAVNAV